MIESLSPRTAIRISFAFFVGLVTASCRPEAVAPCGLDRTYQTICDIENPEDLIRLDGTPWILLAQGRAGAIKAPLAAVNLRDMRLKAAEIDLSDRAFGDTKGDPACDGPPPRARFRGIDARPLGEGRFRIAGVNGTEVQRVELFDATTSAENISIVWVGCVEVPRSYFLNDIALGPDGDIYAAHMYTRAEGLRRYIMQVHFLLGDQTGFAVAWKPNKGWSRLRNSSSSFPNGIVLDRADRAIYMTSTYASAISRIDLVEGTRKDVVLPIRPDNVSWSDRNTLIVAGGNGLRLISTAGCLELSKPGCAFPFGVVEIDPDFASRRTIFSHQDMKIPGASSAVLVGNALYLGSAAADRVTVVTP